MSLRLAAELPAKPIQKKIEKEESKVEQIAKPQNGTQNSNVEVGISDAASQVRILSSALVSQNSD